MKKVDTTEEEQIIEKAQTACNRYQDCADEANCVVCTARLLYKAGYRRTDVQTTS